MKYQIRRGCFETNSSSTHSMQLMSGDVDEAIEYVRDCIVKSYGKDMYKNLDFDPFDFMCRVSESPIKYDVYIRGLDLPDGDEYFNAYCIINNWMARIQYIGMLIKNHSHNFPEIYKYWGDFETKWKGAAWHDHYGVNTEYTHDVDNAPQWEDSHVIEVFKNWVKTYIEEHQHVLVREVKIDESHLESLCFNDDTYSPEIFADDERLTQELNNIIDPDNIVVYKDEAYNPGTQPEIKIL